jgi:hypothetical protein
MAELEEIATNVIIPPPPRPAPGVAPLVHAPHGVDGQIWPFGSAWTAVAAATTPQPCNSSSCRRSAILPITNPTAKTASSPGAANNADDTPQKGNVTQRKFPDCSCAFSQDNALLLGNESDRWVVELDNMQEQIAAANNADRDDASNMEDPVVEVQEFEYILENIAMDKEEGNADNAEGGVYVYNSLTPLPILRICARPSTFILAATRPRSSRKFGTVGVLLLVRIICVQTDKGRGS